MSDPQEIPKHEPSTGTAGQEQVTRAEVPVEPAPATDAQDTPPAAGADEESTVGTGTSIALGCVAGTVLLIVLGLIVIGLIALIG